MTEETQQASPAARRAPSLWARAAWTLLPLAAALIGGQIALPGVDDRLLPASSSTSLSVVGLGVLPFVSASVLVELVALVVPGWAPLRHGGPAGRLKLGRAAAIVGIVLAVLQGFAVARFASSSNAALDNVGVPVPIATITLVAGSSALFLLAEAATRRGLVSGMALLIVLGSIRSAWRERNDPGRFPFTLGDTLVQLLVIAATATATWYVLERHRKAEAAGASVPVPASGVVPLVVAASLLTAGSALGGWGREIVWALRVPTTLTAVSLALLLAVGALFSWLFNLPARVAALTSGLLRREIPPAQHLAEARAAVGLATVETLIFLVALFAIDVVAARFSRATVHAAPIALGTALAIDLVAEWRARRAMPDLVPVWPEHRPYALATARAALAAAGIPVHARGERLRRLLQWGAPYVPIDLMVPKENAERAARLLDRLLRTRVEGDQEDDDRPEQDKLAELPGRAPTRIGPRLAVLVGLTAAVVVGHRALWIPSQSSRPKPKTTLELVAVDDEDEIVDQAEATSLQTAGLPPGISIQAENAPLGVGVTLVRRYARIVRGDQEGMLAAARRLLEWAEARRRPEGVRVAVGPVIEHNDLTDLYDQIGWRTYLLKGPPVVTGADVVDAAAVPPDTAQGQGAHVMVELGREGAKRFEDFTAANIRRRLAILVDGQVASAPMIMSRIPGGMVHITMGAGDPEQQLDEAQRLARGLLGR